MGTPQRKLDPAVAERMATEGVGVTAIARSQGVSRTAVYDALRRSGTPTATRALTDAQEAATRALALLVRQVRAQEQTARLEARLLLAEGVPVAAITEATGWDRKTVARLRPATEETA